jgi:hypothetical protein
MMDNGVKSPKGQNRSDGGWDEVLMRDTGLISIKKKYMQRLKVTLCIASGLQFDKRRGVKRV